MDEQKKPGRRTRDEEIDLYLANLGLDRSALEARASGAEQEPENFAEMLDMAAAELWADYKNLKGVAKVQAFNAFRQLAKQEPEGGTSEERDPTVAEVIQGIPQLSDERKREILTAALGRIDLEREQIAEVLNA